MINFNLNAIKKNKFNDDDNLSDYLSNNNYYNSNIISEMYIKYSINEISFDDKNIYSNILYLLKNNEISFAQIEEAKDGELYKIIRDIIEFNEDNNIDKSKIYLSNYNDMKLLSQTIIGVKKYISDLKINIDKNIINKIINESKCILNKNGYIVIMPQSKFSNDVLSNGSNFEKNNNGIFIICKTPENKLYQFLNGQHPIDEKGEQFKTNDLILTSLKQISSTGTLQSLYKFYLNKNNNVSKQYLTSYVKYNQLPINFFHEMNEFLSKIDISHEKKINYEL